jgi:hypothetical protein
VEYNDLEKQIPLYAASAMFGPPGRECDRTGPTAKPRTLGVGWIIYGLVRASRPKLVLEIGTGGSSACIMWGLKHNGMGHLHTYDIYSSGQDDKYHRPADYEKDDVGDSLNHCYGQMIRARRDWGMEEYCTLHKMSSVDLLPKWNHKIDMLVVDGDHSLVGLKNDVQFLKWVKPGGYGLFHDFIACLMEVGLTLTTYQAENWNEWSLMVEPNCLSLAIMQRKFSLDPQGALMAHYLSQPQNNPNAATTPFQMTEPRACGAIRQWTGAWFNPVGFHDRQEEANEVARKIIQKEAETGKVVESLEEVI